MTRIRKLADQYGQLLAAAHARGDMDFDPRLSQAEDAVGDSILLEKNDDFIEDEDHCRSVCESRTR